MGIKVKSVQRQIKELFNEGISSPKDIAKRLKKSSSHVRQEYYRMRHAIPPTSNRRYVLVYLTRDEHIILRRHALAKNVSVPKLIKSLLKVIIEDKMIESVLDGFLDE